MTAAISFRFSLPNVLNAKISVAGQQGIATLEKLFGRDEPLKGGTGNYQVLPRRKRQLLCISGDKSHLPVRQQVGKASAHLVAYIIQYQLFRMKGAEQRTGQEPGSAAYLKHMPRTCRQVMCQHIVQATGYLFLRRGLTVITFLWHVRTGALSIVYLSYSFTVLFIGRLHYRHTISRKNTSE